MGSHMATLRLKKRESKPLAELELPSLVGQFCVVRQHPDFRAMRFTAAHETLEKAMNEAKRLKIEKPYYRYMVVQAVAYAEV